MAKGNTGSDATTVLLLKTAIFNLESIEALSHYPNAEIGPPTAARNRISHIDHVIVETNRSYVRIKPSVDQGVMEGVVLVAHG